MAHDARCGEAKASGCRCGGCAGSLHGWPGALPTRKRRGTAPHPYPGFTRIERGRSISGKVTTHRQTIEVANRAREQIIVWLAAGLENPPTSETQVTSEFVSQIADTATGALFKGMDKEAKEQRQLEQWRKTVHNHFLCTLFASLACELMEIDVLIDEAKKGLTSTLTAAAKPRSFISDALVRLAATIVVDQIFQTIQESAQIPNFRRALRLSAIMSCPDPRQHTDALRCCVKPLEEEIISDEIRQELLRFLP